MTNLNFTQNKVENALIPFKALMEKGHPNILEGRNSGSFVILDVQTPKIIQVIIKEIPEEKKEKYVFLAKEKAERLAENPTHLSSYESRDEKYVFLCNNQQWGKWGGAIRVNNYYIFAFSGFPELLDEAFVCFLAIKYEFMKADHFKKILKRRSDNPYLKKLEKLFWKYMRFLYPGIVFFIVQYFRFCNQTKSSYMTVEPVDLLWHQIWVQYRKKDINMFYYLFVN